MKDFCGPMTGQAAAIPREQDGSEGVAREILPDFVREPGEPEMTPPANGMRRPLKGGDIAGRSFGVAEPPRDLSPDRHGLRDEEEWARELSERSREKPAGTTFPSMAQIHGRVDRDDIGEAGRKAGRG
jgi:hypothetical protein